MGWSYLGILFAFAAILCAVGFYKYVYFLSIGYGFAIAGLGIVIAVLFRDQMETVHLIQCLVLIIYGIRLSGFLMYREIKNAAYRKTLSEVTATETKISLWIKIAIWISVAALYVAQVSPIFYRQYNCATDKTLPWIGIAICLIALLIESLADQQKSSQKKVNPNMVATKGLYKVIRCPNYFGEILFWTGITVGGLTALESWGQWTMAIVAYICIVGIMFNGAQRLEKRQIKNYGKMAEYQRYADSTPILLPLIPLYHLNKERKQ